MKNQISEMLHCGFIVKSFSQYNAPIWVVPKKWDISIIEKWHYQWLNAVMMEDMFRLATTFFEIA